MCYTMAINGKAYEESDFLTKCVLPNMNHREVENLRNSVTIEELGKHCYGFITLKGTMPGLPW